jgi:endonuclease/exonuclease/phosphatase family metal-dependent hydrolase
MKKVVILCASVAALAACETPSSQATTPVQKSNPVQESTTVQKADQLKLVSWNIEHLADDIGKGCKPRSEDDYAKLSAYAQTLNADIVALQEVQSEVALQRVFPASDWQYVVSTRPDNEAYECRGLDGLFSTPQRTAIVIRKGVNYKKNDDFTELALDNPGLRYGTSISINNNQLTLLNVHMKSGCFVSDYSQSDRKACLTYQQQAPLLESWVNTQVENQQAMVVLGDFNHRLVDDGNRYWQELSQENNQRILTSSMQNIQSCHPKYKAPIDHIVTGPISTQWVVDGSQGIDAFGVEGELTYDDMLSDHCPISVTLKF